MANFHSRARNARITRSLQYEPGSGSTTPREDQVVCIETFHSHLADKNRNQVRQLSKNVTSSSSD